MKIAIVCGVLDTSLGGGLLWSMQFIQWLAEAGHDVHVITPRNDSMPTRPGVTVHSLSPRSRTHFATLAEAQLQSLSPDISHDMGCGWFADIFHSHVGSPKAFYESLISVRPWWKRLGQLKASRLLPRYLESDRLTNRQFSPLRDSVFVALSKKIVVDFQNLHEIPLGKIKQIHNGVDVDRFKPEKQLANRVRLRNEMGIGLGETVLLQVARNPELKGVPELIQAASRICRDRKLLHVVVVGCKPRSRLRHLISKSGLADRVHFISTTGNIEAYYQMSDACVHATHYDACSLTVLEAMASGLPVITTRCNGAADLLNHGKEGFILDGPDDPRFTTCIRRLLDRDRCQRMGIAARETAESNSLQKNFENIFALYQEVWAQKRAVRSGPDRKQVA